ncbi:hypothetical protein ACH5RR_018787 [Cinchona calisaya]|uniref:Receptor-like serine/threonine-protein kinase n=1 Tax=Cinchona calisaya TaxID=153742 RepID=A0ABD2ZSL5_9GENT
MRESFVLLLSCCVAICTAIDTITISRPIQDHETLVSSGQNFRLAFFSPVNSSDRYVGIMFNIPGTTTIWVANRDKPVKDSTGILSISEDGNLVILNGKQEILWSSNVSNSLGNSSAQLFDTGNLVLTDNSDRRILWESFQIPTDSLVPKMRLSAGGKAKIQLTSWRSPSDPSIGNFSAGLNLFRLIQFFVWKNNEPCWRSGPWNGNTFIGIPGMSSAYQSRLDLVEDNSGSTYFTYNSVNNPALFYYTLNSSGSLQAKVSIGKGDWNVTWSSLKTQCDFYGKCGPFGSCNPRRSPICTCLQGFKPRDEEEWSRGNWTGGCIRKELLQCERNQSSGQDPKQDGFVRLENMKVPDFTEPVAFSEEGCGRSCLKNCSCTAYAYYNGIGCMHWSGNLIDVQKFSYDGADLYLRVPYSELDKKNKDMKAVIASIVVVASLLIAVSAYLCWKWLAKRKGKDQDDKVSLFESAYKVENAVSNSLDRGKLEELPLYTYETLAEATDNFQSDNELGKGGFGPVYKGKLIDGQEIAVKRLSTSSGQGIEEFMNEVVVISKLQHRNLVRLLGCCVERDEKMLVYEYMPHKSLDFYLFDSIKSSVLDWNKRIVIIDGIGRGLLYLHRDSRLKIIHRDLKASNILLDEELKPKISDFGLARIFGGNENQANTNRIVGTYGYMAPEYAMRGKFSEKSDVYSFGVLLLEIISGKRNTSFYHDENDISLLGHAWKMWNKNETAKLVDQVTFHPDMEREVLRYVHIGLLCVQDSAKDRPNVSTVLSMLNSELGELPHPKLPAYTATLGSSKSECSQQRVDSVNNVSLTTVQGR